MVFGKRGLIGIHILCWSWLSFLLWDIREKTPAYRDTRWNLAIIARTTLTFNLAWISQNMNNCVINCTIKGCDENDKLKWYDRQRKKRKDRRQKLSDQSIIMFDFFFFTKIKRHVWPWKAHRMIRHYLETDIYIPGSDDKSAKQSRYLQNSAWCLLYPSPSPLELSEECLLLCFWPNILWIISAMLNVQVIPELERKEEKTQNIREKILHQFLHVEW